MNRSTGIGLLSSWMILWSLHAVRADEGKAIYPIGIACAAEGPIYLADLNLPGIWKLEGETLTLHHQASKKFRTPLNRVRCLALDSNGKLLAGCTAARNVFQIEAGAEPVALSTELIEVPMSLAVGKAGEIYIADLELRCIWLLTPGSKPVKFADVPPPRGIFLDSANRLWVLSQIGDQLIRLSPDGKARESVVKGTPFKFPHNVVVDENDTAFVTDGYDHAVWKIEPGKEPRVLAQGAPLVGPVGIARRGNQLLVVDPRANALIQIEQDGSMKAIALGRANK